MDETLNLAALNTFESNLEQLLLKDATFKLMLKGHLFDIEELDQLWNDMAPEYMIDAVPQIAEYPLVSVAWTCYIGMGAAHVWDTAWNESIKGPKLYKTWKKSLGFDYLDEHILRRVLGLKEGTELYEKTENMVRSISELALSAIRMEEIEPQTPKAFHCYARTLRVLF